MRFFAVLFHCVLIFSVAASAPASAQLLPGGSRDARNSEAVDLRPIHVPVISRQGTVRNVSLLITLEIDSGRREQLAPYHPRLMDAYLRNMYDMLGSGAALGSEGEIDVDLLQQRLRDVTAEIIDDTARFNVYDVLLTVMHAIHL